MALLFDSVLSQVQICVIGTPTPTILALFPRRPRHAQWHHGQRL